MIIILISFRNLKKKKHFRHSLESQRHTSFQKATKTLGSEMIKLYTQLMTLNGQEKDPFISLPNDKNLGWSELKAIADDKINVTEKL